MSWITAVSLISSAACWAVIWLNYKAYKRANRVIDSNLTLLDDYEDIPDIVGDGNKLYTLRRLAVARRLLRADIPHTSKLAEDLILERGPSGLIEYGAYVERRIMTASAAAKQPRNPTN